MHASSLRPPLSPPFPRNAPRYPVGHLDGPQNTSCRDGLDFGSSLISRILSLPGIRWSPPMASCGDIVNPFTCMPTYLQGSGCTSAVLPLLSIGSPNFGRDRVPQPLTVCRLIVFDKNGKAKIYNKQSRRRSPSNPSTATFPGLRSRWATRCSC